MAYLAAVIVVGLVIAIHEYGHLLAAKWCGIPVARFSIGFGPKLLGFQRRRTEYWLSAIPLGGYVLPVLDESEFRNLPLHKSIAFAMAGPLANITSALPLPPLDGGRTAFAILQRIYRPLVRIQTPVALAGWALMLALMVYATVLDLGRIGIDVLS